MITCARHSSWEASVSFGYDSAKFRRHKNINKQLKEKVNTQNIYIFKITFCLSRASKSVLSFHLLFRSLIGRFPTYLPENKQLTSSMAIIYLWNWRSYERFSTTLPFISLSAAARSDGFEKLTNP